MNSLSATRRLGPLARCGRAVVLTSAILLAVTGCIPLPSGGGESGEHIVSAIFSQYQSTPDFDDSLHETDDPTQLAALEEILAEHGITGDFSTPDADCPPGSLETTIFTEVEGGGTHHINTCGDSDAAVAIGDLISAWRS